MHSCRRCILCAGSCANYLKMADEEEVISDASPSARAKDGESSPHQRRPKERSRTPEKFRRPEPTAVDKAADGELGELLKKDGSGGSRFEAMFAAIMASQENQREQMTQIRQVLRMQNSEITAQLQTVE